MTPLGGPHPSDSTYLPMLLNGRLIGEVEADNAKELATKLRTLKTLGQEKVSGLVYKPARHDSYRGLQVG